MKKLAVGILGCGAIGSRIAKAIVNDMPGHCRISGFYDLDTVKMQKLAKSLNRPRLIRHSFKALIDGCDVMVEAVTAAQTDTYIRTAVNNRCHVLAMSVGKLLSHPNLFRLAALKHCQILIPSGAIAGLDAVKAASQVSVKSIRLTTRKPLSGFSENEYLMKQGISLSEIDRETVLFDGSVQTAVKAFPQNINVAAALALASGLTDKLKVRIITSPDFKVNSHEIEMIGDFGRIVTCTENVTCPDNPKTSYLAVLSAIRTLKDFSSGTRIGT